jgi:Kdo2-lipid IVA lauroyltransferase/acyltransferase
MSHIVLAVLWLFHWLPLPVQAAAGHVVGSLLWRLAGSRRRIALRNLELCIPELILERALLWYSPPARLRRLIEVQGDVGLADRSSKPVMWLVPHFVGLDVAGIACMLHVNKRFASIYQSQTNAVFDAAVRRGRTRLGKCDIFARSESVKPLLRCIRAGMPFFNLPDMDFGGRDAVFAPFFGVDAATLTAPSRIARAEGMLVQPVIAELLPGGRGYRVTFKPPLEHWPTNDAEADTAMMNRIIESEVRTLPAQYLWVHKRFKTRPAGEPSLY